MPQLVLQVISSAFFGLGTSRLNGFPFAIFFRKSAQRFPEFGTAIQGVGSPGFAIPRLAESKHFYVTPLAASESSDRLMAHFIAHRNNRRCSTGLTGAEMRPRRLTGL